MGVADTVLLFRTLTISVKRGGLARIIISMGVTSVATALLATLYAAKPMLLVVSAALAFALSFILTLPSEDRQRMTTFCLCCVMMISGGLVNPIQQGVTPLTKMTALQANQVCDAPQDAL